MLRKIIGLFICVTLFTGASLALAGGAPPAVRPYAAPCPPAYGAGGNPCAFWGDAPIPGLCGGVIALPFLVVGTLLGGNPTGPCGPSPSVRYNCAPPPYPPQKYYGPPAGYYGGRPPGYYGPAYGPYGYGGPTVGGIPAFDIVSGLVGGITGGAGLL